LLGDFSDQEFAQLQDCYIFDPLNQAAREFFADFPHMVRLLLEGREHIEGLFGSEAIVSLNFRLGGELVAYIHCDLNDDDAIATLDAFEDAWWLEAFENHDGWFVFDVLT